MIIENKQNYKKLNLEVSKIIIAYRHTKNPKLIDKIADKYRWVIPKVLQRMDGVYNTASHTNNSNDIEHRIGYRDFILSFVKSYKGKDFSTEIVSRMYPKIRDCYAKERYAKIRELLIVIKKDWKLKDLQTVYKLYQPMVNKIWRKLNSVYGDIIKLDTMQENSFSFFSELVWQYDMQSPVNFTRYLKRKMYFRIKNYYKEEVDFDRPVLHAGREACLGNQLHRESRFTNDCPSHYNNDVNVNGDLPVGSRQDSCAVERSKADESMKNKYDWHVVINALNEKELDILLCTTFLELRQREIAEIFDTVQAVISRLNKKVNQKIVELRLELA